MSYTTGRASNDQTESRRTIKGGRPAALPAIEFRDVHLAFGETKILAGLSFKVRPGEMKIVLGGSGTGKTSVLKLILGLTKPDSGQIIVDGAEITSYTERRMMRVRKQIGMVFQEGALFDSLSVYDNVAFRLHEQGTEEHEVETQVRQMLRFVNLERVIGYMPSELSGGMRRRVGIARALVGEPGIILFDEPTAGLDPPTAHVIARLAVRLRDLQKVSSIFVTHRINIVKYLCSRRARVNKETDLEAGEEGMEKIGQGMYSSNTTILMLREGRAIFDGSYEGLCESADPFIQRFLRGR